MKRIHILFATVLSALSIARGASAADISRETDSLLRVIDRLIVKKPEIVAAKRTRINSINRSLVSSLSEKERWKCLNDLFREYRNFSMDTSLLIAREARKIAEHTDNDTMLWRSRLMEVEAHKGIGNYHKALAMLDSMPAGGKKAMRNDILNRYCSIYYSLYDNTFPRSDAEYYKKKQICYRDTLVKESAPGSMEHFLNLAECCLLLDNPEDAIDAIKKAARALPSGSDTGVLNYITAKALLRLGRVEEAKLYLSRAAASDLQRATRKYEALQNLANLLNSEGDTKRAYRYISSSLEDIMLGNARSRISKVSEYLPIINNANEEVRHSFARGMFFSLILTVILLAGLALLTVMLVRRSRRLDREKKLLAAKNEELERLRHKLDGANRKLEKASKVKEEYIGYLFNLCSEYIDIIDKYQRQIARKIKTGTTADIDKLLSTPVSDTYLKPFYRKFDSIFLDIFPDFVNRFNDLLKPEYKISPKEGELLTPELRIFALVRLGIGDSTRIASFLHYSAQTVYNYRQRIRNRSILPREEFKEAVKTI